VRVTHVHPDGSRDLLFERTDLNNGSQVVNHVRWGAVREMGFLSMPPESPEALEFLILALGDRSPQIRLEAAGLLGRLAGSRTVLERAMGRESVPFVRDAIAETLADLK
jgi:HEAT repeat protein